jgi:hypothetical protein
MSIARPVAFHGRGHALARRLGPVKQNPNFRSHDQSNGSEAQTVGVREHRTVPAGVLGDACRRRTWIRCSVPGASGKGKGRNPGPRHARGQHSHPTGNFRPVRDTHPVVKALHHPLLEAAAPVASGSALWLSLGYFAYHAVLFLEQLLRAAR